MVNITKRLYMSNRKQKPEHKVTVMSMDENNLIRRL